MSCPISCLSYISYSYQLSLVTRQNKIFGLEEEARENIKQEETKVPVMFLSQLPNLLFSLKEAITRHVDRMNLSNGNIYNLYITLNNKLCICPNCQLSKLLKSRIATQFLLFPICRDKKTTIFMLSPVPSHDQ